MSIYGNKSHGFSNENAELHFAKDYNRFLYSPDRYQSPKSRNLPPSAFDNSEHSEVLKANLVAITKLRLNSPNYKRENPITYEGKTDQKPVNHVKKTPFTSIDNIRDGKEDRDTLWKPCLK